MRDALSLMLASVVAAAVIAGVWFWTASPHGVTAPQTVSAAHAPPLPAAPAKSTTPRDEVETTGAIADKAPAAPAPPPKSACANPDALGVTRVVEIDTTGGPGFGFAHFKQFDFLTDKEVVLTFDDGPWPSNTPAVRQALSDECTKAGFFPIGQDATH